MARPKKQLPPPKDHQLSIRFTEELFDVLVNDAAAAGMPWAEYIRQLITNHYPVVKQQIVFDSTKLLQVFRDLDHYGANLSQIARYLNQGGSMTSSMWKEIKDCVAEIYEIRNVVREMTAEYRGSH
ncbi:MAG: hypothetical protein Q4C59_13515 [Lachnospiraceae bacterium]|nr:hypothetical protein [Lachnospiraceae bacterium]